MLNFSSVRFSSVFVCRTESRVVGSLSSQIFPEWRLCVHYYISLSLSLCDLHSLLLAGWLAVYYTHRVSYRCSTSCTLDCIHPRPVVNYRSPIVFLMYFNFYFSFFASANFFACLFHSDALRLNRMPPLSNVMRIAELFTFLEGNLGGHGLRPRCIFIDGGGQWAQVLRWHWQLVDPPPPYNMYVGLFDLGAIAISTMQMTCVRRGNPQVGNSIRSPTSPTFVTVPFVEFAYERQLD